MTNKEIVRAIYNQMHTTGDKVKGKWEIKLHLNIDGLRWVQYVLYPTKVRKINEDIWLDLQDKYYNIILRPQYCYKVLTDDVFGKPKYEILMDDGSKLNIEEM